MTNMIQLNANWDATKIKLKEKFGILTDQDLKFKEGKQDDMISKLELTLGRSKEEMYKLISEM